MQVGRAQVVVQLLQRPGAGEQGIASAIASTAQQLGGSVGLAVLVALLSERAGGPRRARGLGPTAQPPGIMVDALHVTFAAQAGIALVGAVVALVVIGRGPGLRRRHAERGHVVARALEQQGGTP